MPNENTVDPTARRVRLRRRSGGFAGGGVAASSVSESLRAAEPDYSALEDEDLADQPADLPRDNLPSAVDDPRARISAVSKAGSASYAKEYRLALLHRLLMRNIPLDQIAGRLGVSISTVEKDRVLLKERLQETAKELNINLMVGQQTGLYDEVSAMALRTATDANTPTPMKLAAMRTALAANADKNRFYHTAGVYDVLRFRRSEDGDAMTEIQMLMEQTDQALRELMSGEDFDEFTVEDDPDDEVMDL